MRTARVAINVIWVKTTIASGQNSASTCTTYDVVLSSPEQNVTFADITASLEAFTLMFWMNCPLGNVIRPSFGFFRGGTYESMLNILDRQNFELFGSTIQVTMNGWTHITVRWSNTALRAELMIHGNTVGSTPVSIGYIMASGFHLQMSQSIGNNGSCRISGLQMKNTSRSDVDIQTDITTCTPSGEDAVYTMDNFKHKIGIDIDTPSMCDEVDECDSSPCGGHFCENLLNGYRCECKGGYTGDNCEIAPDYCVNHQCENGATCVSGEWNYTCTCASNFKGALCEDEIVNGNWAEWGTYSVCSQTCNGGTKTRVRTCTNPSPGPDGADCSGNSQDQVVCNTEPCPECEPFGLLLLQSRNTKEDGCVTEGDYTRCGIVCETGMEFVNPPKDYYECGANTSFEWNGIPPSCSRVRPGQRLTLDTSVKYPSVLPCGAETDLALLSAAGEAQCVRNNACTMSVSTTGCSSRRKRNTGTTAQISFIINLEDLNDFNLTALLEQNIVSADLQTYIDAITELEQTAQQINSSFPSKYHFSVECPTIVQSTYIETHHHARLFFSPCCDNVCPERPPTKPNRDGTRSFGSHNNKHCEFDNRFIINKYDNGYITNGSHFPNNCDWTNYHAHNYNAHNYNYHGHNYNYHAHNYNYHAHNYNYHAHNYNYHAHNYNYHAHNYNYHAHNYNYHAHNYNYPRP
ncbi:uncharacterized protein [Argopecten irradians]|uniref:uncharacterized protein n=1 Tax=Argopecten irradians TaxID=31199 RepID=UPI0037133796